MPRIDDGFGEGQRRGTGRAAINPAGNFWTAPQWKPVGREMINTRGYRDKAPEGTGGMGSSGTWGSIWSGINSFLDGVTNVQRKYNNYKGNPSTPNDGSQGGDGSVNTPPAGRNQGGISDAAPASQTWIPGIENNVVMIGAAALLGVLVLMR